MDHRFDQLERLLHTVLTLLRQQTGQEEYHSVTEAAEILRLSEFRVRELLKAGLLGGFKSKRKSGPFEKWVIPADSIRDYQAGRDGHQEPPRTAACPAKLRKPTKAPSENVPVAAESLASNRGA